MLRQHNRKCSLNVIILVTDFTYIRTKGSWLYLSVVVDLFSRQVVGLSMKASQKPDLAIDALLMAIWQIKPKQKGLFIQTKVFNTRAMTGDCSYVKTTSRPA